MEVAIPAARNFLAPLGIIAPPSAINARIEKKMHGSRTTTLISLNKEMNGTMKTVLTFEDSNILLEGVIKTIKNKTKKQKGGFLRMLLGSLRANPLGNI